MCHPTPCLSSAIAAEIRAVPASQAMTGPVLIPTYGYPGFEIDLIAGDIFPAGNLSAMKASLLLGFCLRTQNGSRLPPTFAPLSIAMRPRMIYLLMSITVARWANRLGTPA
jgi:hypothetical protein